MNRMMKKLTAALTALACVPVMGMTANAEELGYYWGTTTWSALDGYEQIDDHGMLSYKLPYYQHAEIYLNEESVGWRGVIRVNPRTGTIRLVLRDGVDEDEAARQIAEAVDTYYPGVLQNYDAENHSAYLGDPGDPGRISVSPLTWNVPEEQIGRVYELYANRNSSETSKEAEAGILLALAKKHLLSEYYGWGGTAYYERGYLEGGVILEELSSKGYMYDAEQQKTVTIEINWEEVQTYLTEHYPGLAVESGNISGIEDWRFREKMELMFELWEKFGVNNTICFLEEASPSTTGHNALEQPGDVDLDTEINILDVIAANKDFMGAELLDCDTAKKNGDINGNGKVDATDSLTILKYIVGIEENLG